MKKIFLFYVLAVLLFSCNSAPEKTEASATVSDTTTEKEPDLPFKAIYSSKFTDDVSDADLAMVMQTYKDWADGNAAGLESVLADSVDYDASSGYSKKVTKAALTNLWKTFRDSLSSVKIDMYAWKKMYATDKKEGHVVTWYKEIDTYKDVRIDSATYHDINGVKDGKLVWYSSMKRPFLK